MTHDLELYGLALELNGPDLEVDANGGDVALGIGIIGKTEQQARLETSSIERREHANPEVSAAGRDECPRSDWTHLADTGVADEEELEEVVVFASVHRARRGLEAGGGSWGGLAGGRGGRR